jgi:hypothetical protein
MASNVVRNGVAQGPTVVSMMFEPTVSMLVEAVVYG